MTRLPPQLIDALGLVEPDSTLEAAYRTHLAALEKAGENANYAETLQDLHDDIAALVQWFDELRACQHLPLGCVSARAIGSYGMESLLWERANCRSILKEAISSDTPSTRRSAGKATVHSF